MSQATLSAPTRPQTARRAPRESLAAVRPAPGAAIDAHAPTFEWDGGGGSNFVLEIARDPAFDDVVARVPTASSTSVTLYDLFRPDDERYFWRVTADGAGTTEARSFIAAPYDVVSAAQETAALEAAKQMVAAAGMPEVVVPVAEPPYLTGTTSIRTAGTIVLVMVISFLVTAGLLIGITISM